MNKNKEIPFEGENAKSYDEKNASLSPIKDNILFLCELAFADLPKNAHILCVGAGTGDEAIYLANLNPEWHFTLADPSPDMLDVCKNKIKDTALAERCTFHEGYIDTLTGSNTYDAATCLFVAHFILDREKRITLYRHIASRLKLGGILINAEISGDKKNVAYEHILELWKKMRIHAGADLKNIGAMMAEFERKVSIRPAADITRMLTEAGLCSATPVFQALLIHGWISTKD